jgi:hypothetical protein
VDPESGWTLGGGLLLAILFASLSTWIGIAMGRWMRAIQR